MDMKPLEALVASRRRERRGALLWPFLAISLCALFAATVIVGNLTFLQQPSAHQIRKKSSCQNAWQTSNPVMYENTCPGTSTWRVDHALGADDAIEGFTSAVSVNAGESLNLFVSTTARQYTFTIYRMGWYQGRGGRLMYTSPHLTGIHQSGPIVDPFTHMVSCSNWRDPVKIDIPVSWVSGYYIVKLVSSQGNMRYTSFVVRNDQSAAPIIYTSSFLTSEAYNPWGGYSLYLGRDASGNTTIASRSLVVSFDRPYYDDYGLMNFAPLEMGLLRWLERNAYNMTYSTDVDTDLHGSLLLRHQLVIDAGHDEYLSTSMRANLTAARDNGVSLAFFGANDGYWHIRLTSSPLGLDREVICYKHGYSDDGTRDTTDPLAAMDPGAATVRWRDAPLNNPEDSLLGEMYHGIVKQNAPLVVANGATPFLNGTGLQPGSSLPGLVGTEYDSIVTDGSAPSNVIALTASPVHCASESLCPPTGFATANSTIYSAPSGARVFDAGTFFWARGLDPGFYPSDTSFTNVGFQRFTTNLLSYLLARSSS